MDNSNRFRERATAAEPVLNFDQRNIESRLVKTIDVGNGQQIAVFKRRTSMDGRWSIHLAVRDRDGRFIAGLGFSIRSRALPAFVGGLADVMDDLCREVQSLPIFGPREQDSKSVGQANDPGGSGGA